MEFIVMAYPKKLLFGGHFDLGPRISHRVSQLWINCKHYFIILHNERHQGRHGNYINGFSERNPIVFRAIW